ncbi:hypothetical protein QJQ45_019481, partial [Haematococcus lacustris]
RHNSLSSLTRNARESPPERPAVPAIQTILITAGIVSLPSSPVTSRKSCGLPSSWLLARVKACSERAVIGSLLLGFLVRNLFSLHAADHLNEHGQPFSEAVSEAVSEAAIPNLMSVPAARWPDRILALAYVAAGFNGSGTIGCKGVPVSQMLKEALRQFPVGRVLMVDEIRTSRGLTNVHCPMCQVKSKAKRSQVRNVMCSRSINNII